MLIAAYTPNARVRGGPSGKVVVISDSAAGATSAPPTPCTARAVSKKAWRGGEPADQRGGGEQQQPGDEHLAAAEQVPGPAAEQQQPAEGQRVGVDHPFQAGPGKAERPLDVRQGDVDDGRVQHHHQLRAWPGPAGPGPGAGRPRTHRPARPPGWSWILFRRFPRRCMRVSWFIGQSCFTKLSCRNNSRWKFCHATETRYH